MKKISKKEVSSLVNTTLTWAFLNFAFNLIGLWISKAHNEVDYLYPDNVLLEFVIPTLVQSLLFGIFFAVALIFLKNSWRKWSLFAYAAFQFLVYHVFFLMNLKISHGLHFVSSFKNIGVKYMGYFGNSLVDLIPISGSFDTGIFAPDKTGVFYLCWVLLNILFVACLSWLSVVTAGYFFDAKFTQKSMDETQTKVSEESIEK